MPAITVLMPVYNAALFLEEALRSVLEQDFRDFELTAVDDGSTDGSAEILERVAAREKRLRPIHSAHCGIVPALNLGLAAARGRYIVRMDADDISAPGRLAALNRLMEDHPDVSMGASRVRYFMDGDIPVGPGYARYQRWLNSLVDDDRIRRDIFIECPMPHPSMILRTGELMSMGGYRGGAGPEDYDLVLRYFAAGKRFKKVRRTLYLWRIHAGRLSHNDSRYGRRAFRRTKMAFLPSTYLSGREEVALWGAGPNGKAWARDLVKAGMRVLYFVEVNPRKIGQDIHGAQVISTSEIRRLKGLFTLCAVAAPGARRLNRARLTREGFRELADYIFVE